MNRLYLLGASHGDKKGPERLEKFLGFVRPSHICVEASPEMVQQFEINLAQRNEALRELDEQDEQMKKLYALIGKDFVPEDRSDMNVLARITDYEIGTSYDFARANPGVIVLPIGDQTLIQKQLALIMPSFEVFVNDYMSSEENSRAAAQSSMNDFLNPQYDADNAVAVIEERIPGWGDITRERDKKMAEKIMQTATIADRLVVVCGYAHFFGTYEGNLRSRLLSLNPILLRLSDIDQF